MATTSYDVRNQKTSTAQRTAEMERLNFLALKSRLNKEYEDQLFERAENQRLELEPPIPVFRSKDELMADMTIQRQLLKEHLMTVMSPDQVNAFLGLTFKSPDYAILTNQYWDDIAPKVSVYKPLTSSFLYEWLNRYFYNKQKMGTDVEVVVDPTIHGDLFDIAKRTGRFIAPTELSDGEVKQSVREIVTRNYNVPNPTDDYIRKFYIQSEIIGPTNKLSMKDWRAIYDKEIKGFDDRLGSYLPHTTFTYTGFKNGAPLPGQLTPQEAAQFAQTQTGSLVPQTPKQGAERAALPTAPPQTPRVPTQAVVPNQEGEPEEEEQEQAPQEQEQAPRGPPRETDPPEVMVAAVFEAGVPATYEEYTKKLKELYDKKTNPFTTLQSAVKYLREEKGVQITLSRNPTKNSYFNAYKNAVMKKQGGPVRRGRGALGLGVGYKFGKHEIHKRGLKKKF